MKDCRASLEKLRGEAAEAALIRDLATDQASAIYSTGCTGISAGLPMGAGDHKCRDHLRRQPSRTMSSSADGGNGFCRK
jgi:hypothetical protein